MAASNSGRVTAPLSLALVALLMAGTGASAYAGGSKPSRANVERLVT